MIGLRLLSLAALLAASACGTSHQHRGASAEGSGLIPVGWTSASAAVVPTVWHEPGADSNAFDDGVSPGPYTFQQLSQDVATRIAADINAAPPDTLGDRSCPIGAPVVKLVYRYAGHTVRLLADQNCGDVGPDGDTTTGRRRMPAALLADLRAAEPTMSARPPQL